MFMVKIQTIVMVAVDLASMEMVKQLQKKFVNGCNLYQEDPPVLTMMW